MAGVHNLEGLGMENTGMKNEESLMVIVMCLKLRIRKWNKLSVKTGNYNIHIVRKESIYEQ